MKGFDRAWVWGYPILSVVVVTFIGSLLRDVLTLANFTMIYILVVLVMAIQRGTRVALVVAFVSFLSLNYFLVRPYYTFLVADPRDVLDLLVFFGVGVMAGQLAARARRQADEARQRAYEQEILYRLTRSFNSLSTNEGVYEVLIGVLKTDFAARQAYVLPAIHEQIPESDTVHYLLLQVDDTIYGTLCMVFDSPPSKEKMRMLNTCASQAALALHRIDLTERARKSQQFEEADRLKTAILHAVSHDLRTPITIIKTSASNLRTLEDRLSAAERVELAQAIEQETDQLDRLIGNLLDLSRLRAGAVTLHCEENSLEEVAGDVAAQVYQRTKREGVYLNFPEDFPLVPFDYGLMLQALNNLMENALRYEPPDRQIEVRGSVDGHEARLWVINHGVPISPHERERIMQPFYHGKDGHIGLGLAIANGIVEAHHGRLWEEDTPGGGATFTFALPLERNANENSGR
ncbi:MAG: DUF4118 domain-containing protein [Anaerolineae bacterium]|nr:DUF4118 domain-containing protein [Anaerolineae bacterium]